MTQSESTPQFKAGDGVTIKRGKHAGKTASVLDVSPTEYSIKYADGGFGVVNHDNVKDRVEPTITATQLGAIVMEHIHNLPTAFIDEVRAALDGQLSVPAEGPAIV
jgi:hypothetical protein